MQRLHTSPRTGPAFFRETQEPSQADPIRFLSAFRGEPSGFWGRGDRWVAWAGIRASIRIPFGTRSRRFDRVRTEARAVLEADGVDWGAVPSGDRPRFFGGFSFLETGGQDSLWGGFPAAAFILPRLTLERRGGKIRLLRGRSDEESGRFLRRWRESPMHELEGGGPDRSGTEVVPDVDPESLPWRSPAGAERDAWVNAVQSVLGSIQEGRVHKAVLARHLDVRHVRPVDPLRGLQFLRAENPRAHVYLFELDADRSFLGAAPEVLAELRDGRFQATAVAGSMPRGADEQEDRDLARRLLQSEKDCCEHRLTVEEMTDVLDSRLSGMSVEASPRVLTLARIQHLETVLGGQALAGEDILSLVEALHPTPAVCGRPRDAALALIRAAEPFDRGWYSGPVGWFDAAGDGDFVPALRAGIGRGRDWRLFAGAGIVAGSDPNLEWEETALKFEPALRALRAGAAR